MQARLPDRAERPLDADTLKNLSFWDKARACAAARAGRPPALVVPPDTSAARCPARCPSRSLLQVQFAVRIFFPLGDETNARQEAKKRLRMILVADRCSLPAESLSSMKSNIVKVVSEFVEVEGEETVDVNMTTDKELGTIYSVSIPVRRVKAELRSGETYNLPEARWRPALRRPAAAVLPASDACACGAPSPRPFVREQGMPLE